jgi:hypothetical protein
VTTVVDEFDVAGAAAWGCAAVASAEGGVVAGCESDPEPEQLASTTAHAIHRAIVVNSLGRDVMK